MKRPLATLALSTMLAGCAGLASLNQASQPTELFVLTPKSTFDPGLPKLRDQIVVETPTATASVNTDQIAVQPTPLQVQYLPDARWVDRAPLIVQALLIESFENSGKVPAVGSSTIGLRADYLIVTDIREFQATVPVGALSEALQIDVRLNIKIIDAFTDRIIGSRSFEEFVASPTDAAPDVAGAFDEALGDTMRDAVEWSIRQIARHARGR
ncbi:ABC-type transport auxiliary lipoprotein family protein [uncultured Tateyamaria sp.]|uniref:ABC-type transport auxiliary lipoprotein family protein n=1 Tax=uncultured Tateyamaria sp. TaxID=455651 RepID=UPI0026199E73|nr:ABC-type transport auxiliary lipoprotein family protein [uncultured Tateyamaria sp.]